MNILEAVLNSQGGAAAAEAGRSVGLSQDQTATALSALVHALAAGLQRNASQPGGLDSLLGALTGGGHARYVDQPSTLQGHEAVADGNKILGPILGSKDASRRVAAQAGAETGLGPDVMKRMLPLVATLVMGAMSRQAASGAGSSLASGAGASGLLDMLGGALDQNRDGSALDDILGRIGRTFGRS